jgi:pseudouridine synthase
MNTLRLQKFLASAGIASRRKAEELITFGKISVNGEVVTTQGTMVDPEVDIVRYGGKIVRPATEHVYIALHKPAGYVTSASSTQGPSVLQLVKRPERLFSVGRLDKDSTGLLLLTNDGDFAEKISHARYGCEKEYFVVLDQPLLPSDKTKLERGVRVGADLLKGLRVVSIADNTIRVVLKQGMHRQIRRMLGRLGYTAKKLKRVRIGKLELGDLEVGKSRIIDPKDV